MNIIICDDDSGFAGSLKEYIQEEYKDTDVSVCSHLKDLKALCLKNRYDLAFIDVVLDASEPGKDNGIAAAESVLRSSPDMRVVFMTAYIDKYADEIYKYPSYGRFIPKPVDTDRVRAYIDRRFSELEKKAGILKLTKGKTELMLRFDSIVYLESDRRRTGLTLSGNTRESHAKEETVNSKTYLYVKLSDIENLLDDRFVRCHKSFIINITHSVTLDRKDINMDNGDAVPISRPYLEAVRRAYFKFKGGDLL